MRRAVLNSILALSLVACESAVECLIPPCALPVAITVSVTSSVTGASIPGAFVLATGYSSAVPCNQAPGTTCNLPGSIGTYELDIGAPGFQTVHRTVQVVGTTPKCGCLIIEAQHLAVALVPSP